MKNTSSGHPQLAKFHKLKSLIEKIPGVSKQGFSRVTDHIGKFSVGFASAPTQAFSVIERLSPDDNNLGLKQLQEDYSKIESETKAVLEGIDTLISEQSGLQAKLKAIEAWALEVEQEALLPAIADQIKGQISSELERQTLGSIVDSLMNQVRTLMREIILSSQEVDTLLGSSARRLGADLEASKHHFGNLKSRSDSLMQQMAQRIKSMNTSCGCLEGQTTQVNGVIFEMVQAVQYDDITSQRLEHVISTANRIDERLSLSVLTNEDKRWTVIASRIAMEQLTDLSGDLSGAVKSLCELLGKITAIAGERKATTVEGRDHAMAFKENIADLSYHLGALFRLSIFDDNFSLELLRNFSKIENTIFQTKRAFDMLILTADRLEKLRTTLDCKGSRSVETLTATIGRLMERIQREGASQSQLLNVITDRLQEISLWYSDHSTPRIMRVITLLRRIPMRVQQMDTDHGEVLKIFTEIVSETQAILVQIKLLLVEMDFHENVQKGAEYIAQHVEEFLLEVSNEEVNRSLEGDLSSLATQFADLANLYTMARERKAHGAVLNENGGAEDDLDGFELF
jgi:hypothetical protein